MRLDLIDRRHRDRRLSTRYSLDTRGVILIRSGRLDQAIEQLSETAAANPRKMSLALHLAWAHQAKGNSEEARRQYSRAEELGLKILQLDPLERAIVNELRTKLL